MRGTKHGMHLTPEYRRWVYMKHRCRKNPKYVNQGITVCDRWERDFTAFYTDMGPLPSPKHSIDRIDGTKGYEPGNCRWATYFEQSQNLKSNVRVNGVVLAEIARQAGITHTAARYRLAQGQDLYAPKMGDRTHCQRGHEWSDANTYVQEVKRKQGGTRTGRYCRVCRAANMRQRRAQLNPKRTES